MEGMDGLKDKERSGRPPDVPKEIMVKIRQEELVDSNTGWDFRHTGNGSYLQKDRNKIS